MIVRPIRLEILRRAHVSRPLVGQKASHFLSMFSWGNVKKEVLVVADVNNVTEGTLGSADGNITGEPLGGFYQVLCDKESRYAFAWVRRLHFWYINRNTIFICSLHFSSLHYLENYIQRMKSLVFLGYSMIVYCHHAHEQQTLCCPHQPMPKVCTMINVSIDEHRELRVTMGK